MYTMQSHRTAPSSRMATSSCEGIDVRKPPTRLQTMKLPGFFKSLGPLKKQSTRSLSDSTASTVATDFSDNEEDYQHDISPLDLDDDDFDLDVSLHEQQIEDEDYGTEDEYTIALSDGSNERPRLLDEARNSPRRKEMLMDDFEQAMLQELDIVGRQQRRERRCARRNETERFVQQDYEVPLRDVSSQNQLSKTGNSKQLELLLDDFEWKSIGAAYSDDAASIDSDDDDSMSEDQILYQYYAMMMEKQDV
mmetsp:Transcript_11886/g.18737  ORF Transcript_11886/g.18737 Transcript_11886/m.18737 type:complete len:250 (+) Transcript_11886:31-780(+)